MVKCELCGNEFKNTQGLRGHMTFVHGKTGSSKILSAPAATGQLLSELDDRLELTETQTEWLIEELNGTDKQLSDITKQFNEFTQQTKEKLDKLKQQLELLQTSRTLSPEQIAVLDDTANLGDKMDEWKASHNNLVRVVNENGERFKEATGIIKGYEESANNGFAKLEREVGGLRSELQLLTVLPSKVEAVKSDVARLADRVAIAERRAKQKPTDNIEEIEFKNGKTHKFKVYKSTDGLAKPHTVTWDPILGNKYVDLSEPLD